MDDPLNIIREALKGIDRDESESDDGWWETSTGAAFGAERKKIILDTVEKLLEERRLLISALVSLRDINEIAKATMIAVDKITEGKNEQETTQ